MKKVSAGKKLVNKLVKECTENVEEAKIVEITLTECNSTECNSLENIHKCILCTLYIVLLSIISTINIRNATYLFTTNT